ncbi:MAG TPA: OmpA family protein [Acetobacteraceae bacterium]|jgi:outer membrane protein OmpA-like peptidoglycan-associated protein|nr:OmpA family protein [Acetobacteraceae bacterium]
MIRIPVLAAFGLLLPLIAHAQATGPIILEGDAQRRTFDCAGRDVVVRGSRNDLTLTGGCRSLEVQGGTSQIRAALAPGARVLIRGDLVDLAWSLEGDGPPPRISTEGRQVNVQQVAAAAPAARAGSQVTRRETGRGLALSLQGDVLFPFGSDRLRPEAAEGLQEVATLIRDLRPRTIHIVGHTDSVGDEAANRDLSLRRARAVQRWLEERSGGAMPAVLVEGRGESEPVAPNATPDGRDNPQGRALNRRVEFVLDR